MTTIENLYYGNIVPAEKGIKRGSEYSKLLNLAARNEEKLSAMPTVRKISKRYKNTPMRLNANFIGVVLFSVVYVSISYLSSIRM